MYYYIYNLCMYVADTISHPFRLRVTYSLYLEKKIEATIALFNINFWNELLSNFTHIIQHSNLKDWKVDRY